MADWLTGTQANGMTETQVASTLVNAATSIFSLVGSNRYAEQHYFKHDDVVIEETARDNRALISAGASAALLVIVLIIILR